MGTGIFLEEFEIFFMGIGICYESKNVYIRTEMLPVGINWNIFLWTGTFFVEIRIFLARDWISISLLKQKGYLWE